jgi:hypothetical protein
MPTVHAFEIKAVPDDEGRVVDRVKVEFKGDTALVLRPHGKTSDIVPLQDGAFKTIHVRGLPTQLQRRGCLQDVLGSALVDSEQRHAQDLTIAFEEWPAIVASTFSRPEIISLEIGAAVHTWFARHPPDKRGTLPKVHILDPGDCHLFQFGLERGLAGL